MSHTVANEVTMSATPMCMPNTMSTSMEPMASNPISISLMRPPLHRSAKAVAQVLPCEQRILDCCEQRTNKNHQVHWPSGERKHSLNTEEVVLDPGNCQLGPRGTNGKTSCRERVGRYV